MSSSPTIDRPTYEVVRLLHQRFRPYFVRCGQPKQIPKSVLPQFIDQVANAVQFLNKIVKAGTTLPVPVIVLHQECVRTLLLSFTLIQASVPHWCPGWDVVDGLEHFTCTWAPADDLPPTTSQVAQPQASRPQGPSSTHPPPYSQNQIPTSQATRLLPASPTGFGLPQATKANQPSSSTPKDQALGKTLALLRDIAGTPVNTASPSTPTSSKTVSATPTLSAPPMSTPSTTISSTGTQKHASPLFLPSRQTTPTPNVASLTPLVSSSPIATQTDKSISSSPKRPLASMVHKPVAKYPVSKQIRLGTFAPFGKQRKPAPKPLSPQPLRSPTPEPSPEPSTLTGKGKKRAQSESDYEESHISEGPQTESQPVPTIQLPAREKSSPETRLRRQNPPPANATNASAAIVKTAKKPKIVEENSDEDTDGSYDDDNGTEPEPEPKPETKDKKTSKRKSKSKAKSKATDPAIRRQQQEEYKSAAHPGLAWSEDLQIPVIQNTEAFKHFKTSLIQVEPVPQTRNNESRIFRASKIKIPNKFILSTDLPGFISTEVLTKMNFSAHTNRQACCACVSSIMKTECEGRGPGEKCINCRTGSCSIHGGFLRQELQSMASSRQVLESAPLISSQLNRLLTLQENLESEALVMSLHMDHFNRELVVLRGMLKDVPRVLWQIEQANPEFEWTDEFLKKLSEIAGWKVAPTVHDAVALARKPTTDMMKRFHPLYPDVGNIGCSRPADDVAYEAAGMELQYPGDGADSMPQASTSSPRSDR
ncbi:hypothetical protein K435DRAFT_800448 [Dendrothele bispora CBS 962.96]|uniref:Uncharacterized protein n=1 Tax=Dendrothele bispora (strain CBS 962.96) TaxID=1314807 RepID=A0A4S8LSI6_DENBC|nr:hypothetical protein K435DRAFT_800448 [Dendrothele bispora CBS 962.96]